MLMEGKSVEEIMAFMDENERTLRENPFKRKSVIVPEKADSQKEEKEEEIKDNTPSNQAETDGKDGE